MARKPRKDLMKDVVLTGPPPRHSIEIVTPEGVKLSLRLASFGERFAAVALDFLFMALGQIIVFVLLLFVLGGLAQAGVKIMHSVAGDLSAALFLISTFLIQLGYFTLWELTPRAATLGKRIVKIRVAARDGGRLTPSAVVVRNAVRLFELSGPTVLSGMLASTHPLIALAAFLLGVCLSLLPLFNRNGLRLGDLFAGTCVIHAPRPVRAVDLANLQASEVLGLHFDDAQLDVYGEHELQVLETVLRERRRKSVEAVAAKIRDKIGWRPRENEDALTFLQAYYTALRARLEQRLILGRRRKDKFDTGS